MAHGDQSDGVYYPQLLRNVPYEVLSNIFILCCSHPAELSYDKTNVPRQVILSHVCSKWRHVALSTGALWSEVIISSLHQNYTHCLFLYRTWIDRAGAHPLAVTLYRYYPYLRGFFQDFVLPFRIKKLDIVLRCRDFLALSHLQTSSVEEFAISLIQIWRVENFSVPPSIMD